MSGLLERAEEQLRRAECGGDLLDEFGRWRLARGNGKGNRAEASADGTAGDSASPDWSELEPLPDGPPPVAAFDPAMLPDTLKPWAADICERVQCAADFVAVAIMAGLGAIIGRKLGIRPQARTDWTVTPNQWALVVGRPGVLKSPAMEVALSPIKRLAALATEAYQGKAAEYRQAVKLAKLKAEEGEKAARKALAKSLGADVSAYLDTEEPEAPVLRRYIANDTTAAALGELHRQNPNGPLVFRDEMVSLLKSALQSSRVGLVDGARWPAGFAAISIASPDPQGDGARLPPGGGRTASPILGAIPAS